MGGGGRLHSGFAGAGVDDEVDVALAVAEFYVFEAVVLVGECEHGLGEEGECGAAFVAGEGDGSGVEGELAGAGAHEEAADADVVAEVEELVEVEEGFADVVPADVDLEALAMLLDLREAGFALDADGHDAAGDGGLDVHVGELFGGERGAVSALAHGAELGDGGGDGKGVGVAGFGVGEGGVEGALDGDDLGELVAAKLVEVFFELAFVLGHGAARFRNGDKRVQYRSRG